MEVSGPQRESATLPPGNNHCSHWTGGRVGTRAVLEGLETNLWPPLESESRIFQPVAESLHRQRYPESQSACKGSLNCGLVNI
jgi:hypothetical protein